MSRVFFISDMHFNHEAIIKYESRPFANAQEMNEKIIKNWNSVVKKQDKVMILGDFGFGNKEQITNIISRLNGNKILVIGNHDRSRKFCLDCGFDEVYPYPILYKNFWLLSHEPLYMNESMPYCNIHGHIHGQKYEGNKHFNVSVERIEYTPILFEEIERRVKSL